MALRMSLNILSSQFQFRYLPSFIAIFVVVTGFNCLLAFARPSEVVAGEYLLKTVSLSNSVGADSSQPYRATSVSSDRVILKSQGSETRVAKVGGRLAAATDAQFGSTALNRVYEIYNPIKANSDCADLMQQNPAVVRCEPNFVYRATVTPNDPGLSTLWAMDKISAPAGWDTATGSKNIIVAVIDSGIDYTHSDLAANMWTNSGEIAGNGIDDDGNGYIDDVYGINTFSGTGDPADNNGHGTHCAGVVGAVGNNGLGIVGVNWNVSLMAGKFLGSDGSGSNAGAIEAIVYAVDHGADVINASWGGEDYSAELYDAVIYAKQHGVLFIAAAGNDSNNNDQVSFYPASFTLSNIISVAATDSRDRLALFSNYGAKSVDVGAPGTGMVSTVPGGYA